MGLVFLWMESQGDFPELTLLYLRAFQDVDEISILPPFLVLSSFMEEKATGAERGRCIRSLLYSTFMMSLESNGSPRLFGDLTSRMWPQDHVSSLLNQVSLPFCFTPQNKDTCQV